MVQALALLLLFAPLAHADNIIVNGTGTAFVKDSLNRLWPAIITYGTDGNGNVSPGGGGGGLLGLGGLGIRTVYSTTPVGLTNWVVLVASTTSITRAVHFFDSSGQTMELGSCVVPCSANAEVRQALISPGGQDQELQIPMGSRVSIRAVSGAVSTGENHLNLVY